MKLSKVQSKAHERACELLKRPKLNLDDRIEVLTHWQACASPMSTLDGAYFTPEGLARELVIEACGPRVIDLCAGIGALAFAASLHLGEGVELVCVEINPDFVEVGKKVLPHAQWICADVFALPQLGYFDCAIGNPPFGSTRRSGTAARYRGRRFEYQVIDIASDVADYGVFLVHQESAPFRYSGQQTFRSVPVSEIAHYAEFVEATGIELKPNCGIDTSPYHTKATRAL